MESDESVELDLSKGSNGRSISLNKNKIQPFDLKVCSPKENITTENINNNNNNNNISNHGDRSTDSSPPQFNNHISPVNSETVINVSRNNFKNSLLEIFPIVNGSDPPFVSTLEGHHLWDRSLTNQHTTFSPTMSDLVGINGIPRPLFSNFANKMLLDPLKTVKSNGGNKRTSGPRSHVHNFNDELSDKMNATERETRSNSAGVISVTGDDSNASGNEGKSNGNSHHHSETELGVKSMDKDDYNDSSVLDLKISSSDAATSSSASKNTNSMVSVGSQLQPNVKRLRKDGDDIVSNGFLSSSKEDYRDKNGRQSSSSTTANATCDNGRTFPCPDCHKTFATQVDLKAHTIRHITQHPFVCMACGKGFKYDHTLDFHIKSQHNVDNGNNGNILPNGSISNSAIAGVGMGTGSYASLSSMKSLNRKSEKPHHRKNEQAQPHRNLSNPINDQTLPLDASTASLAAMVAAASAAASQNTNYGANIKNSYLMDNEDSVGDDNGCGEDANNNHLRASNPTSSSSRPTSSTLNTHTNGIPLTFPPLSLGHEKSLPHNLIAASMSKNIHNSRTPSIPSPPSFNGHSINNLVDFGLQGDLTPRSIQIKSEKVLITLLEGVHPVSKQSYSLYKCCLCGFAFPNMEPVSIHIQSRHSNHLNLTCDKCGAAFKWKNELQLHDQVHKAMDQSAKCKQLIMPSFMQPNQLVLLNPYYGDSMSSVIKNLNGSSSFTGSSVLDNNNVLDCKGDQPTAYHQFHDSNNNKTTCPPNKNSNKNEEDDGQQGLNLCVSSKRGEDSSKDERQTSSIPQNLLGGGSIMTRGVITSNHLANLSTKIQPSAPLNMNTLGSSPVDLKREPESLPNDDMSLLQCASFQAAVAASSTTNPSGKATEPVGDIEETAPGQFKCRFCPKTFDRVFSVHRHERVHTGYKPCICKVCGRGFSEKRNLRHHIIRFHSDGSGRELLKRVRKEKSLSAANFLKRAAVRLLSHSTVEGNGPGVEDEDNNMGGDQNNGDEHLQDVNPCEPSESSPGDENDNQTEHEEFNSYSQRKHQSLNLNKNQTELANCSSNEKIHLSISNGEGSSRYTGDYGEMHDSEKGSSSRRRKGKPSKNVRVLSSDSVGDDSSGLPQSNSNVLSHGAQNLSITNSPTSTVNIKEEMTDDMISPVKDSRSDYKESDSSDTTNGGQSDSSESKSRLHGSFFANYNPRLTLPEKPLKRNESCQPTIGPDGRLLYPCPYCPKTFCSQSDLTRHLNFHENVRPFKCEFCDYQSRTNSQLKVHMMRHAGIKQYLCSVCNYNGVTQSDLNRHCKTRSHILRSGNVCSLCSLGFSTSTLLEDHIMKFHENSSSIVHQSDDNNSRIQNYPSNGGADKKSSLNETDKAEKDSFATIVNRGENNTNHHPLKSNSDRFTVTNLL